MSGDTRKDDGPKAVYASRSIRDFASVLRNRGLGHYCKDDFFRMGFLVDNFSESLILYLTMLEFQGATLFVKPSTANRVYISVPKASFDHFCIKLFGLDKIDDLFSRPTEEAKVFLENSFGSLGGRSSFARGDSGWFDLAEEYLTAKTLELADAAFSKILARLSAIRAEAGLVDLACPDSIEILKSCHPLRRPLATAVSATTTPKVSGVAVSAFAASAGLGGGGASGGAGAGVGCESPQVEPKFTRIGDEICYLLNQVMQITEIKEWHSQSGCLDSVTKRRILFKEKTLSRSASNLSFVLESELQVSDTLLLEFFKDAFKKALDSAEEVSVVTTPGFYGYTSAQVSFPEASSACVLADLKKLVSEGKKLEITATQTLQAKC